MSRIMNIRKSSNVLDHPTTLKIYLYLKTRFPHEVGIRETQRALELKSPSTISWHLDKLEDADIVKKLPSNMYVLTEKGEKRHDILVPVYVPAHLIKGIMIPRILFLFSFLVTSAIFTFVVVWFFPPIAAFCGAGCLVVGSILCFREYWALKRQFRFYSFIAEESVE